MLRKKPVVPVTINPDNQAIYDLNWSDWIDMKRYGPSSRWLRSLITDLIQTHLCDRRIRTILDFGCGEGSTTNCLAQKFPDASVLGVDQSCTGIECGKANYARPNLTFSYQDSDADLGESAYDLVTCFEVLEHVDDWRGLAARLAKASRRYLMVSFPTGRMRKFEVNIGHLRNFAPGEFESFAASLGLRPVQVFYAGFPFYSPIFRNLCDLTNSGNSSITRGSYSFATRRVSDLIFFMFRFLSTWNRFGDQFCGLFEWDTAEVND